MAPHLLQFLVLIGIVVFLVLRLRSVLGTREGFEKPPVPMPGPRSSPRPDLEVIEGGLDDDIADNVDRDSPMADMLARMKEVERDFSVSGFLQGARSAYEMIVTGFERGQLDEIKPFIAEDILDAFEDAIASREKRGLTVHVEIVGIRESRIVDVDFSEDTGYAEITMRFVGELTRVVRDSEGNVVEGSPKAVQRQRETWVFARTMGGDDPNWLLVATEA